MKSLYRPCAWLARKSEPASWNPFLLRQLRLGQGRPLQQGEPSRQRSKIGIGPQSGVEASSGHSSGRDESNRASRTFSSWQLKHCLHMSWRRSSLRFRRESSEEQAIRPRTPRLRSFLGWPDNSKPERSTGPLAHTTVGNDALGLQDGKPP